MEKANVIITVWKIEGQNCGRDLIAAMCSLPILFISFLEIKQMSLIRTHTKTLLYVIWFLWPWVVHANELG